LFDVIEHIEDEDPFMAAVMYHLKPTGRIAINVPAMPSLWSAYDKTVGHVRRYSASTLDRTVARSALRGEAVTYWGMPLVPLLLLRTLRLMVTTDRTRIVNVGFRPPSPFANRILRHLCRLELVPQTVVGTSLMGLFSRAVGTEGVR
jgi:hypothetical protein